MTERSRMACWSCIKPAARGRSWWVPWSDLVRGQPMRGILERCTASKTCPKIIEHFGSAEVWGLKLTPEWVGTGADADIPLPPGIKRVIRMLVPKVDADGNEVGGVPVVLNDAPLGTYLGWNVTIGGARPFHANQICNYAGGMIPFAKTRAERMASSDPRPSLEERYGTHQGYVDAVRAAAQKAVKEGFLLQADADALIKQAAASNVLK